MKKTDAQVVVEMTISGRVAPETVKKAISDAIYT
jgi:hypothetical protein